MGTPPSANGDARPKTRGCPTVPLWDKVRADPADFNCWTALIGAAERTEDVTWDRSISLERAMAHFRQQTLAATEPNPWSPHFAVPHLVPLEALES